MRESEQRTKASEGSRELQQFLIVVEILAFADYGDW